MSFLSIKWRRAIDLLSRSKIHKYDRDISTRLCTFPILDPAAKMLFPESWLSGGMADTQDLKSCAGLPACGFDPRLSYWIWNSQLA